MFDNYKRRLQERVETKAESRAHMISTYFDENDVGAKGYLTLQECKKFFAILLELNYTKAKDRVTFRKIIKLVDIENTKTAYK